MRDAARGVGILPEDARLDALRDYGVLGAESEIGFDRIAARAAHALGTPFAFISFGDARIRWPKARHGPDAPALLLDDVLIVPDAALDPRFVDDPTVTGWPRVRFYAGCPLRTPSGHNVGTLCVVDTVPRTIDPEMRKDLRGLAASVVDVLELRKSRRLLQEMRRA